MPRAGPAMLSLWDDLGGDETAGPWLRRGEAVRLVGALERERGGVAGAGVRPRSSPFPALRRACALVGVWRLEVP